MKNHLMKIAFIMLLPLLFIACKKSSSTTKTKTELITLSLWRFDNAKVNGADVSAFLQTCQKDNLLFFVSGGTGTMDEGATKCNSGDPQTNPFTWNFASNETVLHVSTIFFTGGSSDFNIETLNETQMVLSQMINVGGSMQNAVVTFKH